MTIIFGGQTCLKLASRVNGHAIIFSIRSDERLPSEVEQLLESQNDKRMPDKFYIVGDIVNVNIRNWKVRRYLIEKISTFTTKEVRLFWYDGDLIKIGLSFFEENPIHTDIIRNRKSIAAQTDKNNSVNSVPEIVRFIFRATGRYPEFSIDHSGAIKSLSLSPGCIYQKSILKNVTDIDKSEIFDRISKYNTIKKLVLSFSENITVCCLPPNLEILDCRGCTNINIDESSVPDTLKKLNMSACNLSEIPKFVYKLCNLNELMLYKNKIKYINCNKLGGNLRRLSVYRNEINEIYIDLDMMKEIKKINIGANPLNIVRIIGGHRDHFIELNLRKIDTSNLEFCASCQYSLEF